MVRHNGEFPLCGRTGGLVCSGPALGRHYCLCACALPLLKLYALVLVVAPPAALTSQSVSLLSGAALEPPQPPVGIRPRLSTVVWAMVMGENGEVGCLWFVVVICGVWYGVCGLWFVVCGLWFVVCGLWFVVCGLWFVVCGV